MEKESKATDTELSKNDDPATQKTDDPDVKEEQFIPPEEVAEQEQAEESANNSKQPDDTDKTPEKDMKKKKQNVFQKLSNKFNKLGKKQKIAVCTATVLLIAAIGGALWWFVIRDAPQPPAPIVQKQEEAPKPTTVASRLTGVQVKPELNDLPTTGVMIENSPDARPQSGLQEAGVVYEAIAEGGITRFLAIFLESKPEAIGPVRSVRPYYLDLLAPYDAPIAHAGGSGEGLGQLRSQGFKDLEAFVNPNYYQRISSRYAPHNLYTSRKQLLELQKAKGWTKSTFNGFARKAEEKPTSTPTAKSIDFSISGFLYNPHFDYDAKTNSYLRSIAGKPHVDGKTGKRVAPKVVIGLVTSHSYAGIYSVYRLTGNGTAYIFQDGKVTKGTWEKRNRKDQLRFGDAKGLPIGLNPGQTWISLVASNDAVTYKP